MAQVVKRILSTHGISQETVRLMNYAILILALGLAPVLPLVATFYFLSLIHI